MNSDWLAAAYTFVLVLGVVVDHLKEKRHRKEIDSIHESYKKEREELLDRIMANNIHEFKGATNKTPIKRSETGNFLKDRMEKTMKDFYEID